jgi:hypothetical protein
MQIGCATFGDDLAHGPAILHGLVEVDLQPALEAARQVIGGAMPHLTLPAAAFRESYLAAAEEFTPEGRFMFQALGTAPEAPDAFEQVLARLAEAREGRIKAEGVVPATDFWLATNVASRIGAAGR